MPSIVAVVFIALPWLNPFSPGPTPAVMPWLFTLASAVVALLWAPRVRLAEVAAKAWLAAALLSSLFGLLQYFGLSAALGPWINSTATGEAFANLRQRNQFATLTNIGLAALLWWLAQRQAPRAGSGTAVHSPLRHWQAHWPLVAAALLALGNAASSSRTGLVQLLVLLALVGLWGGWRQFELRRVLLVAAMVYAAAAWALPGLIRLDPETHGILARLQAGDSECASRLTLWSNVLHLIAQKPWLGWGWGELAYAHFITLYPGARFCDILDNAHNLPLHLAVELGLPVALVVCAAGLWLVWRARPWRETNATRQLAWSVLVLILLHSLLEYPLWYGPFQLAFGLCLWLLWRRADLPADQAGSAMRSRRHWFTLAAPCLLAAVVYAAWDYHRISQIYLVPSLRSLAYRDNALEKIGTSWLFTNQVRFAALTTTELTPANAAHIHALTKALLHFSPEPRVVEKLIESAMLLGLEDEVRFYQVRYQAAFAESYARWVSNNPS